jgi:hypothetical protein
MGLKRWFSLVVEVGYEADDMRTRRDEGLGYGTSMN